MYPRIFGPSSQHGDVNPLHVPYPTPSSSGSSSAPARPQAELQPPRANGPPRPPPPPSPAFPTLTVTIDPRFQVAAPVRAPPQPPGEAGPAAGLPEAVAPPPPPGQPAPGNREPLDLELERKLLRELGSSGGSDSNGSSTSTSSRGMAHLQHEDPYDLLLGRYTAMGYGRDEVAMALTIVGPNDSNDADKIVDTCRKYKQLCSMGFRPDLAAGALILHGGDVEQATNTCLEANNLAEAGS